MPSVLVLDLFNECVFFSCTALMVRQTVQLLQVHQVSNRDMMLCKQDSACNADQINALFTLDQVGVVFLHQIAVQVI